jgi:hypothetical protein
MRFKHCLDLYIVAYEKNNISINKWNHAIVIYQITLLYSFLFKITYLIDQFTQIKKKKDIKILSKRLDWYLKIKLIYDIL